MRSAARHGDRLMDKVVSMNALWRMFALFAVVFIANLFVVLPVAPTARMWLVLSAWSVILAALLLLKHGLPSIGRVCVCALLAGLAGAGNGAVHPNAFSILLSFAGTFAAALATFSVQAALPNAPLRVLSSKGKRGVAISIVLGLAVGAVWGIINCFMMLQNAPANFRPTLACAIASLNPAIMEEIAFRAVFLAFCLSAANGDLSTRGARFTCWFMMIAPHTIVHTPDAFINDGPISGILSCLAMAAVFGAPFAALQKKRDVAAAMIAHGTVDFIRFCFFGLPV